MLDISKEYYPADEVWENIFYNRHSYVDVETEKKLCNALDSYGLVYDIERMKSPTSGLYDVILEFKDEADTAYYKMLISDLL
jgi:hypothetical protein